MELQDWFGTTIRNFEKDPDFQAEELRLDVIEQFLKIMEEQGITRADLARMMGCSNAYVTKILRGTENITLGKLVQIAIALGQKIDLTFVPIEVKVAKVYTIAQPKKTTGTFVTNTLTYRGKYGMDVLIAA